MAQENFDKNKLAEIANQQKQKNRNQKEVEIKGVKYVIKKWSSTRTLEIMPSFASLIYVPTAAYVAENGNADEMFVEDPISMADMINMTFQRIHEIDFVGFAKVMLENVYLQGSNDPINIDDISVLHIPQLIAEVADANFLIGLCSGISTLGAQAVAAQKVTKSLID